MLHNWKIWPGSKIWFSAHIDDWISLKLGGESWFEHMKVLEKFQLIWILLACTSFIKLPVYQKLRKLAKGDLLTKLSWILARGNYMDRKECPKSLSKQENIKGTCFSNCQLGQNQKRNFGGIFFIMARKYFYISEEYMTQQIYEN